MNVFLSWSGERSRSVAEALREWLPQVIQAVEPWLSVADIDKGARWSAEIAGQLSECRVGLICLTPENLSAPWLLFEAGALAKTLHQTFVCPYLLDLQSADIQGPLAQFQLTRAEKEDTRKLLHTVNRAVAGEPNEQALPEPRLNTTFEKWWPDLEDALQRISPAPRSVPQQRSDRELLEEILVGVRTLMRQLSSDVVPGIATTQPWERELLKSSGSIDTFLSAVSKQLDERLRSAQQGRKAGENEDAST